MTTTDNLWPDLVLEELRSPKTILLEQAEFLGQNTKNILRGEVKTQQNSDGTFDEIFLITAPQLSGYRYGLFTLRHNILLFPCSFWFKEREYPINNEFELIAKLKEVFNDDTTKQVITALYSQSQDAVRDI